MSEVERQEGKDSETDDLISIENAITEIRGEVVNTLAAIFEKQERDTPVSTHYNSLWLDEHKVYWDLLRALRCFPCFPSRAPPPPSPLTPSPRPAEVEMPLPDEELPAISSSAPVVLVPSTVSEPMPMLKPIPSPKPLPQVQPPPPPPPPVYVRPQESEEQRRERLQRLVAALEDLERQPQWISYDNDWLDERKEYWTLRRKLRPYGLLPGEIVRPGKYEECFDLAFSQREMMRKKELEEFRIKMAEVAEAERALRIRLTSYASTRVPVQTSKGLVHLQLLAFFKNQVVIPGAQLKYERSSLYYEYLNIPFHGWKKEVYISSPTMINTATAANLVYVPPNSNLRITSVEQLSSYFEAQAISPLLLPYFQEFGRVYCVCHSSKGQSESTYIACAEGIAGCGGFVHGACVGLKRKRDSETIVCPLCVNYFHSNRQSASLMNKRLMTRVTCLPCRPIVYCIVDNTVIEESEDPPLVWGLEAVYRYQYIDSSQRKVGEERDELEDEDGSLVEDTDEVKRAAPRHKRAALSPTTAALDSAPFHER